VLKTRALQYGTDIVPPILTGGRHQYRWLSIGTKEGSTEYLIYCHRALFAWLISH
jgi:hypothetical protein